MAPRVSRLSALALCLASLASLARAQAPGDRDDPCPLSSYGDHVRRLLDTRDYTKLLPYESDGTGGVWQVLDEDGDGENKWRTSSSVRCAEVTKVCGRSSDPQENWMITQHISVPDIVTAVQVKINSTLESPCPPSSPSCVDDLSLYVWETSTTNRTSAADTRNYRFVGSVSSGERVVEVSPVSKSGIYLGIRDNGTCVSVGRVLVYYGVCVAGAEGLVRVDQETVFSSAGDPVQGHCVENSVSTTDSAPQLQCQESGQWRVVTGCQCSTQYFLDSSKQQCFKPPLAPVGLKVSNLTNQTLTLSWSPPPPDAPPDNDIFYTVSYGDHQTRVEGATRYDVTGLTPFLSYTFSVTAENSVSSRDPNTAARTASVSAMTLEGVAAQVVDIVIMEGANVFISWSEPDPPHGRILHYHIKIIESGRETIIKRYNSTIISWDTWTNTWRITSDNVKIQIQAETSVGRGKYSEETDVFPPTVNSTADRASDASGSVSTELLIMAIMVPVVLVLVLIIGALLVIRCVSSRRSKTLPRTPSRPLVNVIEDYASIKLSPSDTAFTIVSAPPVPRSPRPQKPSQSCSIGSGGNNDRRAGEDPTYHVLEDQTQPGLAPGENPYSLDPIDTTEVFGEAQIDYPYGENPTRSGVGSSAAAGGQERVYFELEDPQNSSIIKHRTNLNPTYESIKSNRAYWNEGMGPDQPNMHFLTASSEICQPRVNSGAEGGRGSASGPTPPSGGPAYLELVVPSSTE